MTEVRGSGPRAVRLSRRWPGYGAWTGAIVGSMAAIGLSSVRLVDGDANVALVLAVTVGGCALLGWLIGRAVQARKVAKSGGATTSGAELEFSLRGEPNGTFRIGRTRLRVKVKRGQTGSPANFSDDVGLDAVREIEVRTLVGEAEAFVGLGFRVRVTDGPALVLRVVEPGRGEDEEIGEHWVLAVDDPEAAAEAIRVRQAELPPIA